MDSRKVSRFLHARTGPKYLMSIFFPQLFFRFQCGNDDECSVFYAKVPYNDVPNEGPEITKSENAT